MAAHVDSAKNLGRKANKAEFYAQLRPGDLVFCSGRSAVSRCIEGLTESPWSHVLMAWLPGSYGTQWLTLEATIEKGVHVGMLADYVDGYYGDLAMARRPVLTQLEIDAELNRGLALLDDGYDWEEEVSIAARKLVKALPLLQPRNELYCSGLQYAMSLATTHPLGKPAASYPTPEDNWTDKTVAPVCVLTR